MFRKHFSLMVAESVFNKVERLIDSKKQYTLECFDNCREQGYCIQLDNGTRLAVAEHRSSDSIVVYVYYTSKYPSNLPADDQWNNSKTFNPDKEWEAAHYIVKVIKENS